MPLAQTAPVKPVIYRLVLQTAPGRVDTGASYPGCAQNNTQACMPIQFANVQDAINYARAHNEVPVQVASADEAWKIIAGAMPINPAQVLGGGSLNMTTILLLAGAAIFLVPKLFKR